jgi:predicted nucleic acid-binding protein
VPVSPAPLTIDANVYVSAVTPSESAHASCLELLRLVHQARRLIVTPILVRPEVAAALSQQGRRPADALAYAESILRGAYVTPAPLGSRLAESAARIAVEHRLRGADAVYAAVALRYDAVLVTNDRQLRDRGATIVTTRSSEEILVEFRR